MSRFKDKGPYAKNNVAIVLQAANNVEKQLGKIRPPETRRKISKALKGLKFSEEHKANISKAGKKWWSEPSNRLLATRRRPYGTQKNS